MTLKSYTPKEKVTRTGIGRVTFGHDRFRNFSNDLFSSFFTEENLTFILSVPDLSKNMSITEIVVTPTAVKDKLHNLNVS